MLIRSTKMPILLKHLAIIVLVALSPLFSFKAYAGSASMLAGMELQRTLEVYATRALDFGVITRSGKAGDMVVAMKPDGTYTGDCVTGVVECRGGQAGIVEVYGSPNAQVTVILPAGVTLRGDQTGAEVELYQLLHNAAGFLDSKGYLGFYVSGSVFVSRDTPDDTYNGSFEIRVNNS